MPSVSSGPCTATWTCTRSSWSLAPATARSRAAPQAMPSGSMRSMSRRTSWAASPRLSDAAPLGLGRCYGRRNLCPASCFRKPPGMTALSQRLVVIPALGGAAWRLALPLGGLHAAMFVYDLAHPDRFLNADRAGERIQVVAGFGEAMQSGDPLAYLTSPGIVG